MSLYLGSFIFKGILVSVGGGRAIEKDLSIEVAARALRGPVDVDLFEEPFDPEVLAFARRIDWSAQEDGFPEPQFLNVRHAGNRKRSAPCPEHAWFPPAALASLPDRVR